MKSDQRIQPVDGNTAAAHVAYAYSQVAAIYPITPSSVMGELADSWSAEKRKNIWGEVVDVIEMQSEGGAAGAVHGSLSAGALTTTFTASQGLLLMIPNMYKISGELQPGVIHVAARALASHSLSIFGDHQDVMATRATGWGMIASSSVQENVDMAIVSHLTAIESRIPFVHFFDGFRTSSEVQKVDLVDYETLKSMVNQKYIEAFRLRSLNPERPVSKVGAQNPDVYFQGREASNKYYDALPGIVKKYMEVVYKTVGRKYNLFDYVGHPQADKIIISMCSSCETIEQTLNYLNQKGAKLGLIKVRLYRPFSVEDLIKIIPKTAKKIAVLDRTKEPGAIGEPLYMDVRAAITEPGVRIIGGRYGLSSKEFTPAMVKTVYDHLDKGGYHNFSVGITDDITNRSLIVGEDFDAEPKGTINCKFWGLGSDGTVGANKNSIKIIGDHTDMYVQGYFAYDSKKSGGITVSHLRFGNSPIQSTYELTNVDFVALHNRSYIGKYDLLKGVKENGVFLLNSPWEKDEVMKNLTKDMQETIIKKKIKVYTIDATKIAQETGMGGRINTVMQAAFFKLSKVIDEKKAAELIKDSIIETYKLKGQAIIDKNLSAVERSWSAISEVAIPNKITEAAAEHHLHTTTEFEKQVIDKIARLKGDEIPVSAIPVDGAIPTGTSKLEKRGIAIDLPRWIPENCIQCAQCSFVCPHASIRVKQIRPADLNGAPNTFKTVPSNTGKELGLKYKVQVYPEDCVGCASCAEVCPAKNKALIMVPIDEERARGENENQRYYDSLPDYVIEGTSETTPKGTQIRPPLFEFSGACAGCGETPYIKLVTQLFGERMIIANATGCSSIYGGTFPTIPYTKNKEGRGPAWGNSLFEDNAEYGFGMRLAVDANRKHLKTMMQKLLITGTTIELKDAINEFLPVWDKTDEDTKKKVQKILNELPRAHRESYGESRPILDHIMELKDFLLEKSVWIIGGDGWAYDIGFGGLDHVLAQGKNVNMLVLDTEVYSNTGGQSSKATPLAAIAKFASAGKKLPKKNLGLMMTTYGYVYVAMVNMGASKPQLIKALLEAERFHGPSIVIAYSPCQLHGYDMRKNQEVAKKATACGYWPLFRYNPDLTKEGKNPFILESPEPSISFRDYILTSDRFKGLNITNPDEAETLFKLAEEHNKEMWDYVKNMSTCRCAGGDKCKVPT